MVMLALSPTYRQLCALSVEKFTETAVPMMLVCSLIDCSATKPHLPASPAGLLHGFPSAGSDVYTSELQSPDHPVSHLLLEIKILTQCNRVRKNAGLLLTS